MTVRPLVAPGLLVASGLLVLGAASPALAVCDSYSGNCPKPPGGGSSVTVTDERPSTLPFTGGELVLLSTLGVGALVGGTALVVAGRRKASPSTPGPV